MPTASSRVSTRLVGKLPLQLLADQPEPPEEFREFALHLPDRTRFGDSVLECDVPGGDVDEIGKRSASPFSTMALATTRTDSGVEVS